METSLQLQVEKLESILRHYKRDINELSDMNNTFEIKIKIHDIQKDFKEREISDQKNNIEKLFAKIEELKDEKDFNQRLKNQDIKKKLNEYKEVIICMKKIINDKDEELTRIRKKLKDQESEVN